MNRNEVKSKKAIVTDYGIIQYNLASMNEGEKVDLVEFAVGDADYEPQPDQTDLVNEVYRNKVKQVKLNGDIIEVEMDIPPEDGGFTIKEIGLFDKHKRLFAIGVFAATEKPVISDGEQSTVRYQVNLPVDNAAAINITSDPNIDYATKEELKELEVYIMENALTPENIHSKEVPDLLTKSNTVGGAINELVKLTNIEVVTERFTHSLAQDASSTETSYTNINIDDMLYFLILVNPGVESQYYEYCAITNVSETLTIDNATYDRDTRPIRKIGNSYGIISDEYITSNRTDKVSTSWNVDGRRNIVIKSERFGNDRPETHTNSIVVIAVKKGDDNK